MFSFSASTIQLEKSLIVDELDAPGTSGYQPRSNPVNFAFTYQLHYVPQ